MALVDGAQVELVDPYWLFAALADSRSAAEAAAPVCAMPVGDPWMENMLRPLIESLGYRVVAAGEGIEADILIAAAEDEAESGVTAAEIVRLRSRPELSGENDNSIYRYDRAALLEALSRGASKVVKADG